MLWLNVIYPVLISSVHGPDKFGNPFQKSINYIKYYKLKIKRQCNKFSYQMTIYNPKSPKSIQFASLVEVLDYLPHFCIAPNQKSL